MYALILKSDEDHPTDWICYQLSYEREEIEDLRCYSPENLYLPKDEYDAEKVEELFNIESCRTGDVSEFAVYEIMTPINLSHKFQFTS